MSLFQPAAGLPRRSRPPLSLGAIGFVTAGNNSGPAVTRSGAAIGMLAVVVSRRINSTTAPSNPAKYGTDTYAPAGAVNTSYRVSWKLVEGSDLISGDTYDSGTFTNGGRTMVALYDGPVVGLAQVVGSTPATTTARAFTSLTGIGTGSWVGGYVRSPSGSLVPPGGFSRAGDTLDQIFDTNAIVMSWAPAAAAAGTSGAYFDIAWEIERT